MQRVTVCSTSHSGGQTVLESLSSEEGYSDPLQTSCQGLEEGRHFTGSVAPYQEVAAAPNKLYKNPAPYFKFPFPGQAAHMLWGWGGCP